MHACILLPSSFLRRRHASLAKNWNEKKEPRRYVCMYVCLPDETRRTGKTDLCESGGGVESAGFFWTGMELDRVFGLQSYDERGGGEEVDVEVGK